MPNWVSKIRGFWPVAVFLFILSVVFKRKRGPSDEARHYEAAVRAEMKKRIAEGASHDKEAIRREVEADLAELDSVGDAGFLDRARQHRAGKR